VTEGSQAQDQAGQSRAALKQRVQRGRPGKNAPRQREQAAVAPWGKPPKPMVLPPCAAPGNPPPGACGRSHPTSAGIDAAYCGSLGAAGGGQLGTAAATEQAAAGQNDARAQSTPGRTCTQDQVREGFTAGHQTTRS
jgi:hypothetical protein